MPPELLEMLGEGYAGAAKKILRDKDYADALAEFHWNDYNALIKRGFSKEQALQIVLSQEMRSAVGKSL